MLSDQHTDTVCTSITSPGAYKYKPYREDSSRKISCLINVREHHCHIEHSEKACKNLLCIIDEVLRGTNTIERIGASSQILAHICKNNVLSFAATHDIELSYMLQEYYENYHFEEEVREKDVVFNYLLKKGRVTTRNAIRLLEMIGYDKTLIEEAKRAVEEFEASGSWKNVEKAR